MCAGETDGFLREQSILTRNGAMKQAQKYKIKLRPVPKINRLKLVGAVNCERLHRYAFVLCTVNFCVKTAY